MDIEENKDVFIKKSMNEEDTKILRTEGRGKAEKWCKNDRGKKFLWKVKDTIMKWYINSRYVRNKRKKKRMKQLQKSDQIKVMYTNIDGIITRKPELTDYLKEKKP